MRVVSCTLLSTTIVSDSIGVQKSEIQEIEIPIIRTEDVYANEFYKANEQGLRPTLRLRTSALNYNGEEELIYMDKRYSVIRSQEVTADEIVLICERKLKNV